MAGLTVKERDKGGLSLERFQEFPGRPVRRDEGSGAILVPFPEMGVSESTALGIAGA